MPEMWSEPRPMLARPEATIRAGPQPQPLILHSGAAGFVASSGSPCSLQAITLVLWIPLRPLPSADLILYYRESFFLQKLTIACLTCMHAGCSGDSKKIIAP